MKECPFCGSTDVQISNNDGIEYYGKCNSCFCFSEEALTSDDALANWERRAYEKTEKRIVPELTVGVSADQMTRTIDQIKSVLDNYNITNQDAKAITIALQNAMVVGKS